MNKKTRNKSAEKFRQRTLIGLYIFVSITIALLTAGRFLTITETPMKVDTIIVLSGGTGRVEKAAELYKTRYESAMILSNVEEVASKAGDMLQTALASGIPQDAILTENAAQSTYQNALYTLPIMKEHGFKSAIVVSSDFHMRRVKYNFEKVYKGSGIKLTYIGADSGYNAKRWWSESYSREITFNEYVKLIGNALGYNGPEAKVTLSRIKKWFLW
ncbi:YdcF family protein [Paenibacillus sp. CN-4]|uniref:YdcF family protein n=1 Tax=Paenibacillus nanchangensis TaxID=3348343 RepID=UPI00397D93D1